MKLDVTKMMIGAETLISQIENPRHIAILKNYRRHAMLEVAGFFDEIFHPNMTVENPRYVAGFGPEWLVLDGETDVKGTFYADMIERGAAVMILEDEHLAVADWGLASEYISNDYLNYIAARERGFDVPEDDTMYLHNRRVIMTWRYSDDCRLIGEHVSFEPGGTLTPLAPEDVVTTKEATERLSPLIGPLPPRYDYNGQPLEPASV